MKLVYMLSIVLAIPCLGALAQSDNQKLSNTIFHKDSLFWTAYNNCDSGSFRQFFSEDVEFYHDKGGLTQGLEKFHDNMKKNLCGNNNFRLRREAIEGTVRVFPLQSSGVIYGAIISGDHVFYVLEQGKRERLDGQAKFSHLWLLKDSVWKMARILSYDHGPAKYINKRKEITLSKNAVHQFAGVYQATKSGTLTVKEHGGSLVLTIGNDSISLYPEAENLFFVKDRDLSFEFVKNEKNKVSRMLVRENGQVVEEAILKN